MDGDHDQFEEVDDDLLSTIPLDYPQVEVKQEQQVQIPSHFPFPFQPYDIQVGVIGSSYYIVSYNVMLVMLYPQSDIIGINLLKQIAVKMDFVAMSWSSYSRNLIIFIL